MELRIQRDRTKYHRQTPPASFLLQRMPLQPPKLRNELGTFTHAFSQAATFQGYFPKWQLPKGISQVATFQRYFPKWPLPKYVIFKACEMGTIAKKLSFCNKLKCSDPYIFAT